MTGTGKGDWHESLFKDQKGDSLGDGTWGKPTDDGKLAPVAWDKLPEAPNKKVRARLATPAPGSQKESGLLDIKTLAPSLSAGMAEEDEASFIRRLRQPTPPPADVRPARLATAAKGSAGSGLIDVQELVRMQEQKEQKEANKASDSVADAAIEAMNSSASISNNALPGANLNTSGPRPVQPLPDDLDDLDMKPDRGRSMVVVMLAILTVAVGGLAYYVLTSG